MHANALARCGRAALVPLLAALGLQACSSVPPPEQQVTAADVMVRDAEQAQAASYAPAPLRRAQDKLQQARAAMRAEAYVQARRLAEQAAVDAELAEVEARSEIARQNVEELRESIDLLRREAERAPATS